MLPKSSRVCLAALVAASLAAGTAFAQDSNQALLDLLVKKGVLTQQDVTSLKQELAASQAAAPAPAAPAAMPAATGAMATSPTNAAPTTANMVDNQPASPLSFNIGIAKFTPFGFLDFTGVYRNEATGSAIGTSFNSIPYSNGSTGQMSETKFSAQNSRLGLRVDSTVKDTTVLGYVETDFLGNAPTNLGVSSNSDTLRMRVPNCELMESVSPNPRKLLVA